MGTFFIVKNNKEIFPHLSAIAFSVIPACPESVCVKRRIPGMREWQTLVSQVNKPINNLFCLTYETFYIKIESGYRRRNSLVSLWLFWWGDYEDKKLTLTFGDIIVSFCFLPRLLLLAICNQSVSSYVILCVLDSNVVRGRNSLDCDPGAPTYVQWVRQCKCAIKSRGII